MKHLFLTSRFFLSLAALSAGYLAAFFLPGLLVLVHLLLAGLVLMTLADLVLVSRLTGAVSAVRKTPERLSLGDENEIRIQVRNSSDHTLRLTLLDELPAEFQVRTSRFRFGLPPRETHQVTYRVFPQKRGLYFWGDLITLVSGPAGLALKRIILTAAAGVPVYPSFLQMKKYELMAFSGRVADSGMRKVRRIGHSMEFEQVREYVTGDDIRTLNWKAAAKLNKLMVNQFQDEKSQAVYAVIDLGRTMKRSFNGISYLDYAINSSLAILNIALKKDDKAGLVTFSDQIYTFLGAEKKSGQIRKILSLLYNQATTFRESDFQLLVQTFRTRVSTRSLLLFFTNPETLPAMERMLPYLKVLSRIHVLVVIFFENTELDSLRQTPARDLHGIYRKSLAEMLDLNKKQMVLELKRHGIYPVLTTPDHLTTDTLSQYLELKSRGII
ncbi:MAG: DUF58 domain-containing protein [Bacteroidetes bacterium]|nr:DUF58 domain-containing protein [Bacteroidota bacterium]